MAAELKPYPGYKDSGVEWLGKVPTHWEVRRAKHVFRRIVGGSTPSSDDSRYWGNVHVWVTPADVSRSTRIRGSQRQLTQEGLLSCSAELMPAGSIVVTSRAPVGNVALAEVPFCTNQGCKVLVPDTDEIDSAFAFNLLHALQPELQSLAKGTTFTEVSGSTVGDVPLPLPPLPEQAAIVRFLDHADRRIRRYIRAKEKLIALLEEQKQAIIHEAVTGRIDVRTGRPYAAYKPSGVEWLGDVPEHWEKRRLKTVLRPVDRRSATGTETLLSLRRDHGVVVYAEHFSRPPQGRTLVGFKLVRSAQLVVNRLQANNGLVFCSHVDGLVSPDYSVFEARRPLEMQFLSDLLRTVDYRSHFRTESTGLGTGTAGFLRLYDDDFLETVVFLPSVQEQTLILQALADEMATNGRIVRNLDREQSHARSTIERSREQVGLVREYRARLIADVVTGNLDVREAAARLPDVDSLGDDGGSKESGDASEVLWSGAEAGAMGADGGELVRGHGGGAEGREAQG